MSLQTVDAKPAPKPVTPDFNLSRVALSFLYFFFILAAYYTVRPVKDALAVEDGVERLPFLYLITLIVMLMVTPIYGWLSKQYSRRRFVPLVYVFFILNLAGFYFWFSASPDGIALPYVFFVWVSCFSLFVVSVFWSVMADVHSTSSARKTFGIIAAGGSSGAICGDLLTSQLVKSIGAGNLPLISMAFLTVALVFLLLLFRGHHDTANRTVDNTSRPMGGEILAGARLITQHRLLRLVALFMFLGTFTGALIYAISGSFISEQFAGDRDGMTAIYATINLWTNSLTLTVQFGFTWWMMKHIKLGVLLALLPILVCIGFGMFAFLPVFSLIVVQHIIRRSTLFAITNPATHMLYTAVGPQSKYKFKNFTETVIWRAGDTLATSIFLFFFLYSSLQVVAIVGMLAAAAWVMLTFRLARCFDTMRQNNETLP